MSYAEFPHHISVPLRPLSAIPILHRGRRDVGQDDPGVGYTVQDVMDNRLPRGSVGIDTIRVKVQFLSDRGLEDSMPSSVEFWREAHDHEHFVAKLVIKQRAFKSVWVHRLFFLREATDPACL